MFWSQPKPCAKSIGWVPRPKTRTLLRVRTSGGMARWRRGTGGPPARRSVRDAGGPGNAARAAAWLLLVVLVVGRGHPLARLGAGGAHLGAVRHLLAPLDGGARLGAAAADGGAGAARDGVV